MSHAQCAGAPRCRMPNVQDRILQRAWLLRAQVPCPKFALARRSCIAATRVRSIFAKLAMDVYKRKLCKKKKKVYFQFFFVQLPLSFITKNLDYSRCVYPIPTRPPHILFLFFSFIFSRWPAVRPVPPAIVLSKLRSRRSHGPRLPLDRIASSPRALRRRRSLLPSPVRNPPRAHGRRPGLCW